MRMMMRTLHRPAATIAAAILGLSLVGCASDPAETPDDETGGDSTASVYEFQTNGVEPSSEVTVRVPDDLREVMGADAGGLVIDQIVVTAHELEDAQYCAADLSMNYLGNQPLDMIAANDNPTDRESAVQTFINRIPNSGVDDEASVIEWLDSAIEADIANGYSESDIADSFEKLFGTPADLENDTYLSPYQDGDTGQDVFDRYVGSASDEQAPGTTIVAESLGLDDAHPQTDLDESAPESGTYVSEDYTTITVVGDCAASATDPDNAIAIELPSVDADGKSSAAATVEFSVMTDGTIGVAGEVKGYMRDANDNWITN
ncbi:hypothetical protein JOF43_003273 [Brachybacterium sacelli]|uniref:Lipoprotein n=3 Tax=Brachybacterium sacelli TaxID=173364 RepID=A0ABS4X493_9MICO|nr:hypothetical protein [Brachybacterium sacelli]MBP2383284.1 hypothetical protein [Brachybacterium sacelli]